MIVTLLRHSIQAKPNENLSPEGIKLAKKRRDQLRRALPPITMVLSSPIERARETAEIVGDGCPVLIVNELDIPRKNLVAVINLNKEIGQSSLKSYLDRGNQVKEELDTYGDGGWRALFWMAIHNRAHGKNGHIFAVGHTVLIGAIGIAATTGTLRERMLNEAAFSECQGFTLTLNERGEVVSLDFIR